MADKNQQQEFKKKNVLIIGGGVAGMTAAHELQEKTVRWKGQSHHAFNVYVLEMDPKYCGGKARSIEYTPESSNYSNETSRFKWLPGEHGFRFYPGFYVNMDETFKKIKYEDKSVFENLVSVDYYSFYFANEDYKPGNSSPSSKFNAKKISDDKKGLPIHLKTAISHKVFKSIKDGIKMLRELGKVRIDITDEGKNKFIEVLIQVMFSCKERKDFEYDKIPWMEFTDADAPAEKYGSDYKLLFADGISRNLVAARADKVSTRTGSLVLMKMVEYILSTTADADRVLNGPTNETWLTPWKEQLTNHAENAVNYITNAKVTNIYNDETQITEIEYEKDGLKYIVITTGNDDLSNEDSSTATESYSSDIPPVDYTIFAVPAEAISHLIKTNQENYQNKHGRGGKGRSLVGLDPSLSQVKRLGEHTEWMVGMVLFLKIPLPIRGAHINFINSEWALTAICQSDDEIWDQDKFAPDEFGDGSVKGILSIDISNWTKKRGWGKYKGFAARELTRQQVIEATIEQVLECPFIPDRSEEEPDCEYSPLRQEDILEVYLDEAVTDRFDSEPDKILERFNTVFINYNKRYKTEEKENYQLHELETAYAQYIRLRSDTSNNRKIGIVGRLANKTPLLVNEVGTYALRPMAYTTIPNMFLSGDYVATDVDLATMEGANESAKRAVNAIVATENEKTRKTKTGKIKPSKIILYPSPYKRLMWHIFSSVVPIIVMFVLFAVFYCKSGGRYSGEGILGFFAILSPRSIYLILGSQLLYMIVYLIYWNKKKSSGLVSFFFISSMVLLMLLEIITFFVAPLVGNQKLIAALTIVLLVVFALTVSVVFLIIADIVAIRLAHLFIKRKDAWRFNRGLPFQIPRSNWIIRINIFMAKMLAFIVFKIFKAKLPS